MAGTKYMIVRHPEPLIGDVFEAAEWWLHEDGVEGAYLVESDGNVTQVFFESDEGGFQVYTEAESTYVEEVIFNDDNTVFEHVIVESIAQW